MNSINDWIQVIDEKSPLTIEDFSYTTGVNLGSVEHCDKCVAVNRCYFKNQKGKKPEKFEYTRFAIINSVLNAVKLGLYHFWCHCNENSIPNPSFSSVKLIIPQGKINWLFSDKEDWIRTMGYLPNQDFIDIISKLILSAYVNGSYESAGHSKYGYKINLFIDLKGGADKSYKQYKLKSNFMVFPDGKLKCNTLIGGWQK